ncbi:MAG: hypothetical protein R2854_03640 [Caldilineaceae bacterium]
MPVIFTASETFDVGMDLGSPVALDYYERARPSSSMARLEEINLQYI